MRKLKVLIISSTSRDSGGYLRASGLADGLRRAGAKVFLITPPYAQPFFLDYLISLLGNILLTFWRRFDVAVAIKPFPNACLPLWIQKLYGAYTVVDVDDIDYAYRGGFIASLIRLLQRPWPRRFSLVTYHNPLLVDHIVKEFGVLRRQTRQLPQGVRLGLFRALKAAAVRKGRAGLGLEGKGFLLGYSAHLNVAAEGTFILKMLARLRGRLPDSRLLVVGGGPDLAGWKRETRRRGLAGAVHFTGYLEHRRVAANIGLVDVCLLYYPPGRANRVRSSIKLREYLSLGMPVVSNRFGELSDFAGYSYQCGGRIGDFVGKLARLYRSGGDGREKRGQEFVMKEYDWDTISKGFLGYCKRQIEHRGKGEVRRKK